MRELFKTGLIILVAIVAAAFIANLSEIQRYLRLRNM
jgi:hypothetical protein